MALIPLVAMVRKDLQLFFGDRKVTKDEPHECDEQLARPGLVARGFERL